jgi:hypothetical protein
MAQFGSGRSIIAQNQSAVSDSNGNLIVSPDDSFGASPLGVAARTQALYGIPNANFNILPSDPYTAISSGNVLPYWDVVVSGEGVALMQYDTDSQTWAVQLDPTACATAGETITMRARTYLLNDSDLTLRQKAFASITKVGTQATSEWDLVLSATYYDEAGTQLSTYDIGTANSGTTWTTINGFTTSGTAAIDPAAHYADLALTLTTSGSVSGTALVNINSLLIQTSTGGGGATSGFLITDEYTSSGDWVRPVGVEYVTVVAVGAGGGGGSGGARISGTSVRNTGGSGGGGANWAILQDLYVGNLGTVTVGIGAGGSGGTAVFNTVAGTTIAGVNGSVGGVTTFGSLLSIPGGGGGSAGGGTVQVVGGTSGGSATADAYDLRRLGSLAGGAAGTSFGGNGFPPGTVNSASSYRLLPFTPFALNGDDGTNGSNTNGTAVIGAIGTAIALGYGGGGGGGGATGGASTGFAGHGGNASSNTVGTAIYGTGAGGGGGARTIDATPSVLNTVVGGNGGNAGSATGGGGGGGGAAQITLKSGATYSCTSGKGGNGSGGVVYVIYIA